MQTMLTPIHASSFDPLTTGALIQLQPELAASVHAKLDMATVLDLLYGCTDALPTHASANAPVSQPLAWA